MRFDVEGFVYKHFFDITSTTNDKGEPEVRVDCFYKGCSGKKMYINLVTGKCQCFKCGYRQSSLFGLIKDLTGLEDKDVVKVLKEGRVEGASLSFIDFKSKVHSALYRIDPVKRSCKLPDEYIPIAGNGSHAVARAKEWLLSRGLSEEDISGYKIGYCVSGRYKKRVILPVFMEEELVYFNARWVGDPAPWVQKVLNPDKSGGDFRGKSEVLINIDQAKQYTSLVLVEGLFDQIIVGPNASALMGKFLSENQLIQILLSDFDEVVVMLDPDATEDCVKLSQKLAPYILTKTVLLPGGKQGKDPADLGREGCWEYISQAQPVDLEMMVKTRLSRMS